MLWCLAIFHGNHQSLVALPVTWPCHQVQAGLPELMLHNDLVALTLWQTQAVLMILLSLRMIPRQRQSSLPVLPVAALLSCISYHPLYPDGSLMPQMPATLTLSMPQFPGGLQPLVSPCYEPYKCSVPTQDHTNCLSITTVL